MLLAIEIPAEVSTAVWATLLALLIPFLGLVTYAGKAAIAIGRKWIDGWIVTRELEAKNIRVRAALDRVQLAAEAGMQAAEQTIVGYLRAAAPRPGKLTREQAIEAMEAALAAARAHFGPAMWRETADALELPDAMTAVRVHIEAAIARKKSGALAIIDGPPVSASLSTTDGEIVRTVSASGPDATTVREAMTDLTVGDSGSMR